MAALLAKNVTALHVASHTEEEEEEEEVFSVLFSSLCLSLSLSTARLYDLLHLSGSCPSFCYWQNWIVSISLNMP